MLKSLLSATAFGALLALPAMAQDAGTVVATVNGENITLGQMLLMKDGMGEQAANLPDQALWDMLLDQLTRQAAVAQQGEKHITARDTAAMQLDRRAYFSSTALEKVAAPEPTDAEVKALYDQTFTADAPQTEYHAAHILLETEEAAKAVRALADKGDDFAQLAREKSTGPTGPNGGDLGWFTTDSMVREFGDAVAAMKPGDISGPIQTQFGWHVIKLMDSRAKEAPRLEEIRDQLVMQIRRQRVEAEIEKRVRDTEVKKTPDLSPDLLQKTDLLEQ